MKGIILITVTVDKSGLEGVARLGTVVWGTGRASDQHCNVLPAATVLAGFFLSLTKGIYE